MKKLFLFAAAVVFCISFTFSSNAQTYQTLDEQFVFAFNQSFPDWKPKDTPVFKIDFIEGGSRPSMRATWQNEQKLLNVSVRLFESNGKAKENLERFFYMRQIMPRMREMPTIGDKSLTAETAQSGEISFIKGNVSVSLYTSFPRTDKNKKTPPYYLFAPDSEMEFIARAAKVFADMIVGEKTVTPCYNDFYKLP